MSPEIRINGELSANVPDEYGVYTALDGSSLLVDTRDIEATRKMQALILEGSVVGGRRLIVLTQEGKGRSWDPKRGDGLYPEIEVALLNRPIRVSYRDKVWHDRPRTFAGPNGGYYIEQKRTYVNPRWVKGHGQR